MKLFVLTGNGITLKLMAQMRPGIIRSVLTLWESFNHTLNCPHKNMEKPISCLPAPKMLKMKSTSLTRISA